jgi:hypothetical protein
MLPVENRTPSVLKITATAKVLCEMPKYKIMVQYNISELNLQT